jgi:hypothetical protein
MLQRDSAAVGTTRSPADLTSIIQYYSIELAPMADGRLYVGVTATICEHEGELGSMDMGSDRVDSIDKALNVIREAIASHH